MKSMFNGCSCLSNIDLSSFDTKKVKNMNSMFNGCSYLSNIDLSSFDTKNVEDMNDMFEDCSMLKKVKINSINSNDNLKSELIKKNINVIDKFGNNIK